MNKKKQHIPPSKNPFKRLMRYEWIVQKLPFLLFLALLAVVYIANGHWADNTIRDINKTAKELKELQFEYKSLKSEEMFKSRESQIVEAATSLGLKIPADPPLKLVNKNGAGTNKVNEKPDN